MDRAFSPTLSASCVDRRVLLKSNEDHRLDSNRILYACTVMTYVCELSIEVAMSRIQEKERGTLKGLGSLEWET